MTKHRRIILLLTEIFMVLAAVLAFYHFTAISRHLPELAKQSNVPELTAGATPEARQLWKIAIDAQTSLGIATGTLDVCRGAIFLYGVLLLAGSVIHFLATPWIPRSPRTS
jgi:hypothetical protein